MELYIFSVGQITRQKRKYSCTRDDALRVVLSMRRMLHTVSTVLCKTTIDTSQHIKHGVGH